MRRSHEIKRRQSRPVANQTLVVKASRFETAIQRRLEGVLGILLVLVNHGIAQAGVSAKIDGLVKAEMQWQPTVGLALAVMKEGRIIFVRGYGFSNLEHQVPVKPETVFQSASVGKQFAATAVMMLVEEGKINLDDKLTTYFTNAPESWKNISVRHLLTHTSGMDIDFPKGNEYPRDYTEDELLKKIMATPLAFPPGEKQAYSNLGYVTLGILIGKVTGKFWGDFVQERIFQPLGMSTARLISEADIVPNRATGYPRLKNEWKNIQLRNEWKANQYVSPGLNITADGSLLLTVYDMAKWDAALYTEKLLKKSSLDQMWTSVKTTDGQAHPYGFGWELGSVNGHPIVKHSGEALGFRSYIARYLNQKLTVVVFANSRADGAKIAHRVASFYDSELRPPALKPIGDKEPQVTVLVKELVQGLTAGTPKRNLFTPEAQEEFFPLRAKQISENLKSVGTLRSVELVERNAVFGQQYFGYRLAFRKKVLLCELGVTKENKISWISMLPE